MARKLVEESLIPKEHGKGFIVKKGQVLRIIEIEGKQVGDVYILNANDHREGYHGASSYVLNCIEGIGNGKKLTKLYSRPPRLNIMMTVTDDKVGVHWPIMASGCNRLTYALRQKKGILLGMKAKGHRNCFANAVEALEPYGVIPDDVSDEYPVFMTPGYDENGCHIIKPPVSEKGDYIDLRAEMDCIVAISACPAEACNDGKNKPLKVEIWE